MGTFRIPVILFEKTERLTFAGTDYDLSLLSGFYGTAFMVNQVHIILGIGQSHATRFRLHPRHSGNGKSGFGLTETFHEFDACQLLECIEYSGIQCFSGNGAVFE